MRRVNVQLDKVVSVLAVPVGRHADGGVLVLKAHDAHGGQRLAVSIRGNEPRVRRQGGRRGLRFGLGLRGIRVGLGLLRAAPVGLGLLDTDCSFEFLAVGLGLLDTGCSFEFLAVVLGLLETGCKSESLPVPLDLFEAEPGGLEFIRAAPVGVGSYCVGSL